MTEPVHPPEFPALPFDSTAELLGRITLQLGTQLSGLRRPGVRPCSPPSSPWPTAAVTRAPCTPPAPSSNGSASSGRASTSGSVTSS